MDVELGPSFAVISGGPSGGLADAAAAASPDRGPPSAYYQRLSGRNTMRRKRKADSQENERLSKRLSLLNLEQNGQKLYVPVESPQLQPTESSDLRAIPEDDSMRLDDSKHKVYIYNLDDELSDSGESDDGRLVFLPDIEKHLLLNRIPPSILANDEGQLAGMQMVLYSEPTSLTVPEEQDSVRKAIIEARDRLRQKQKDEREGTVSEPASKAVSSSESERVNGLPIFASRPQRTKPSTSRLASSPEDSDSEAMDIN